MYVERVRIERLTENIAVYNLEIGELHTYFVADGVLVHNMCKVGKDSETADKIISKEKKGSIRSRFPSEMLDKTLEEIEREAKKGNKIAQTAKKLLTDKAFNKGSNSTRSKKGK